MSTIEAPKIEATDYVARYHELTNYRDAINAQNAPLEAELAKLVAEQEALRVKAEAIAAKIDEARGREKWIALKREIRILAAGLGKIPPRQ